MSCEDFVGIHRSEALLEPATNKIPLANEFGKILNSWFGLPDLVGHVQDTPPIPIVNFTNIWIDTVEKQAKVWIFNNWEVLA